MIGAIVTTLIFAVAIFAPVVSPMDPNHMDYDHVLSPPSFEHFLGTDNLGRDILSRLIYGSRVSLAAGIGAVGFSLCIGGFLGLVAGYFGRATDVIIMRALDIVWAFPAVLLALIFVAVRGPSLSAIIFAMGIVGIPIFARITRSTVLSVREKDYILAAKASGISNFNIMFSHILPNIIAPVIVVATLTIAATIMIEAILSFLGLGVQPPTPSWGSMINDGQKYLRTFPHFSFFPGLAIMITVFALNTLGDGLRDAMDPKLKT
jgi:peptide/nickel transport system permease protein